MNISLAIENITSHAMITLLERVTKALETGKHIVGLFLDLKKAFDNVDHSILLKNVKIQNQGQHAQLLQMICLSWNNLLSTTIVILIKKSIY